MKFKLNLPLSLLIWMLSLISCFPLSSSISVIFLLYEIIQFETKTNSITNTMSVYVQNLINILLFFSPIFILSLQSPAISSPSFSLVFCLIVILFFKVHFAFSVVSSSSVPHSSPFFFSAGDLFVRTNDKQTSPLRIMPHYLTSSSFPTHIPLTHIRALLPMRHTVFVQFNWIENSRVKWASPFGEQQRRRTAGDFYWCSRRRLEELWEWGVRDGG